MARISVTQIDDKRVHWVAEVAGKRKEWDAEITRQVPDREIDWIGLGDPDNRGRVVFEAIDVETSKVTMMLDYEPEGEGCNYSVDAYEQRVWLWRDGSMARVSVPHSP